MDLLSQRYANPCFFIDGMIQTGRFYEFVTNFERTIFKEREEKTNWEFFLHKVWEGSFQDFCEQMETDKKNLSITDDDIKATIKHTMDIMNNFNPTQKGGE